MIYSTKKVVYENAEGMADVLGLKLKETRLKDELLFWMEEAAT
jgi:hypothetical protein